MLIAGINTQSAAADVGVDYNDEDQNHEGQQDQTASAPMQSPMQMIQTKQDN